MLANVLGPHNSAVQSKGVAPVCNLPNRRYSIGGVP